jgi:multimeric flavodoxin WrbA
VKRLLIVFHTQTGHAQQLAEAAAGGAQSSEEAAGGELEVRLQRAFATGADDLLAADGLILCTPENFGTMSGALKDLFDRTFYPLESQMTGRPYAVLVAAGNDGRGAHREIDRIATGYGWKKVHDGHIARGKPGPDDLAACRELGLLFATGLALGVL